MIKDLDESRFEEEVIDLFSDKKLKYLVILALYKGRVLPGYCVKMQRDPKSISNILLKNNLSQVYFRELKRNSAIHDGIILVKKRGNKYILEGFSYRIFPPPLKMQHKSNMGSGYNSALDYSVVKSVICVYYLSKDGLFKFVKGKEIKLC